jgi:predicted nucleic acid-binding protein
VAVEYGRLRAATEALGRPVASNDLWIAGSATANGLPLIDLRFRGTVGVRSCPLLSMVKPVGC